jgi:sec-independent protein translocase protein TatA
MVGLDNPIHLLFLLVIVLLIFGAKRLPEMGRSLGSGMRGFKESLSGENTLPVGENHAADPARALTNAIESPGPAHQGERVAVADELDTRNAA